MRNFPSFDNFKGLKSPLFIPRRLTFQGQGVIVKPLPLYDPQNDCLTKTIRDEGGIIELGDWIECFPIVDVATGLGRVRFIPWHPSESPVNIDEKPFMIFYKRITSANASGYGSPKWSGLFDSWTPKKQESPSIIYFLPQVFIMPTIFYAENNQLLNPPIGSNPFGPFCLLQMSKSAGRNLRELVLRKHQDLIENDNATISIQPSSPTPTSGKVGAEYVVNLIDRCPTSKDILEKIRETILTAKPSFMNILEPLEPEQQVQLLASAALPQSALVYAFAGTKWESYLPQPIREYGQEKLKEELKGGGKPEKQPEKQVEISPTTVRSTDIPESVLDLLRKAQNS